jgi:hypothetical protein
MKKTVSPEAAKLAEIKQQIIHMTDTVCEEHLDEEYARLSRKLIEKLARKRPPPILRGRPEIWASAVVYALGSANFLFDKSHDPYISATDLCEAFGTKPGSTTQKAAQIRDWFKLGYMGNKEFLTDDLAVGREKMDAQIALMELAMSGVTIIPPNLLRPKVTRENGVFIDCDHAVAEEFNALAVRYERHGPDAALVQALTEMIERDPDYYDPYLLLASIQAQQEDPELTLRLIETAYQRALARILDQQGNWPQFLEGGWPQNQHIIRTFVDTSIAFWMQGSADSALILLRHLLRSNPNDQLDVRETILAIRLGLSFSEYQKTILAAFGDDGDKYDDWFNANSPQFPEEFDWWKKAVGYGEE